MKKKMFSKEFLREWLRLYRKATYILELINAARKDGRYQKNKKAYQILEEDLEATRDAHRMYMNNNGCKMPRKPIVNKHVEFTEPLQPVLQA